VGWLHRGRVVKIIGPAVCADELVGLFDRGTCAQPWECPGFTDRLRKILEQPESERQVLDWLALMLKNQPRDLEQSAEWVALDTSVDPGEWQEYIDRSGGSYFHWLVCEKLYGLLSKDAPNLLHVSPLAAWARDVVRGKRQRPRRYGSPHIFRNRCIVHTVRTLHDEHGRAPVINPDGERWRNGRKELDGCRTVSECLGKGHSYSTVRKIWERRERNHKVGAGSVIATTRERGRA